MTLIYLTHDFSYNLLLLRLILLSVIFKKRRVDTLVDVQQGLGTPNNPIPRNTTDPGAPVRINHGSSSQRLVLIFKLSGILSYVGTR